MMSAVWADCGIMGIDDSAYDVFTDVLGGTPRPGTLTEGLGKNWAILDGYVKIFACCQHTHSAVEAAMVLRQRLDGTALDHIAEVSVETHPQAMPLSNRPPATTLPGRFTNPHVLAVPPPPGAPGAEPP